MRPGHLMVVDDEPAAREALREVFIDRGYDVVVAADGADALAKFTPGVFDCVITDLRMPNMDGTELLKALKQQDTKVAVLLMTGYPSVDSAVDAMREGAYDYVAKPFKTEDILNKVEHVIDVRVAQAALSRMTGFFWALIISIPVWLILGILLGLIWRR